MNPWRVIGEIYLITIIVSFFVAFLIHMMTILIARFGAPKPGSEQPVAAPKAADNSDELAAVAIAVASCGEVNKGQ